MNASDSTPANGPAIPSAELRTGDDPGIDSPATGAPGHDDPGDLGPGIGGFGPSPGQSGDPGTDAPVRELADIPAVEVITRAAVMLMSAAAEKLGLAEDGAAYVDRDEARRLITALAGLYAAAGDDLGAHRRPIADALRGLQAAFREASPTPDPPGQGPGETLRRPPPL